MLSFEVAALKRPIQTVSEHEACGDATLILDDEARLFLAVIDGAGHGPAAAQVAQSAREYLKTQADQALLTLLQMLHEKLRHTRGAVVGLCRIDKNTGLLQYSGIGNVVIRLFTPDSEHLVIRGGVLGYEIINPQLKEKQLKSGDILMLYTDGVKEHFEPLDFSDFFKLSADNIVRITIDYFSKPLDDAACIAVKVKDD